MLQKRLFFFLLIISIFFSFSLASHAWQGRMAGMDDPYGLIADESDFLIHAAKIAYGKGVKLYGHYGLTYTGVTDLDNEYSFWGAGGSYSYLGKSDISGDEFLHDALIGVTFPLGAGRIGVFFTYSGKMGDYDGPDIWSDGDSTVDELESKFHTPAIRIIYGLPLGRFKLGTEAQLAYRNEKQEYKETGSGWAVINETYYLYNLFTMYPYDSSYWEALLKGSLEGKVGVFDAAFTIRGGYIFAGDNTLLYESQMPVGVPNAWYNLDGDVEGWRVGGEMWLRLPLSNTLALPFLLRVDYQTKIRDGNGPGMGGISYLDPINYDDETKYLAVTIGSGLDKALSYNSRLGAGIYYNYLWNKQDYHMINYQGAVAQIYDMIIPDMSEHQLLLRLTGEHTISPTTILRGGLSLFYGYINMAGEDRYRASSYRGDYEGSGDGYHAGIGLSFGASILLKPVTLEPFIHGGYQILRVKWDGDEFNNISGPYALAESDREKFTRNQWYIGAGISVLFGQ